MTNPVEKLMSAIDNMRRTLVAMDPSLDPVRVEKIIADPAEHNKWADEYEAAHPGVKLGRAGT